MDSDLGALPLLSFQTVLQKCCTKSFEFERILKTEDAMELEVARNASFKRRMALENRESSNEMQLERLECYRLALADIISKAADSMKDGYEKNAVFEWTSALASQSSQYYRLTGLKLELIMVLFLHGCGLREKGHEMAWEMVERKEIDAADVSTIFREAGGVFQHLRDILEECNEALPADRPAEVVVAMSSCFEMICLAEAQVIFAYRAAEKGNSPGVVASLHMGASDLFEKASSQIRENTNSFNTISDQFRRYIAISSSLQCVCAYLHMSKVQLAEGQAGKAVRCCQEAQKLLAKCRTVAENEMKWVDVIDKQMDALDRQMYHCDGQRTGVYMQGVAAVCPSLVEGKILAKPISFKSEQVC